MRLLVVEDTNDVAMAISAALARAGMACDLAESLRDARDFLAVQTYDAIVLDINLPDGTGSDILRDLRRAGDRTPVLMLTAQFKVADRVAALDDGADDYLVKPFDLRELEARLRALIRRDHGQVAPKLTLAQLEYDPAARTARMNGAVVAMTRRELALLALFMRAPGKVIEKERLFEGLFSFDEGEVGLNAVEVYVGRLRKKLAGSGVKIETLRGLGYRMDVDANAR